MTETIFLTIQVRRNIELHGQGFINVGLWQVTSCAYGFNQYNNITYNEEIKAKPS
jgi:hypothetical protein